MDEFNIVYMYTRDDRRRNRSPRQSPRVNATGNRSVQRSFRQLRRRSPRVNNLLRSRGDKLKTSGGKDCGTF